MQPPSKHPNILQLRTTLGVLFVNFGTVDSGGVFSSERREISSAMPADLPGGLLKLALSQCTFLRVASMGCRVSCITPAHQWSWPPGTASPFLSLPSDVHGCIADFTGSRGVSYTCRKLWSVLRGYNLSCHANGPAGLIKLLDLDPETHSLTITSVTACGDTASAAHRVPLWHRLCNLASLARLQLHLRCNFLQCCHVAPLAALGGCNSLTHLDLDLQGNRVGESGARALAAISAAPRLTAVALNLKNNDVGDKGAAALAAFKDAPELRTLELNLHNSRVRDAGVEGLAALRAAPALRSLSLDLAANRFGDPGARTLAALGAMPGLTALSLSLVFNVQVQGVPKGRSPFFFLLWHPLSDVWWLPTNRHRLHTNRHRLHTNHHQLPSYVTHQPPSVTHQPPSVTHQPPSVTHQPPSVTQLHTNRHRLPTGRHRRAYWTLRVFFFSITAPPVQVTDLCLAALCLALLEAPLRSLSLGLGGTNFGTSEGMRALLFPKAPERLRHFHLDLGSARLTVGSRFCFRPILGLRAMHGLTRLSLSLRGAFSAARASGGGDQALGDLIPLTFLPALTGVSLDLGHNALTADAVHCLTDFADSPTLETFRLQLDHCTLGPGCGPVLAYLRGGRALRDVDLDLRATRLCDGDLCALAQLREAPCLTSLRLQLAGAVRDVTSAGIAALGSLRRCPTLTALDLVVAQHDPAPAPAVRLQGLARLFKTRALTSLALAVDHFHADRVADLTAGIGRATALRCLSLGLHGCSVGDPHVEALLTKLRRVRALQSLSLDLSCNRVGPCGAAALAELRRAPALKSLTLDLQTNSLGDAGARALAALAECPGLTALALKVQDNGIQTAGMRALSALLENPAIAELRLFPRPEHNCASA